jgi:Cu/Ag efflux pump CusA
LAFLAISTARLGAGYPSTVLTLVVIPVLYYLYLARKEELKTAH